jgi:hypothetical protein
MEPSNHAGSNAEQSVTFLPSFRTVFLWEMAVASPVACVCVLGWLITTGRHFVLGRYIRGMTLGLVVAALLAALLVLVCRQLFPVKLSQIGVVGYSLWRAGLLIRWDEIDSVRPFSLLGLKYLRLYPRTNGMTIWVPLFVVPRAAFQQTLLDFSPVDNPIRAHL